MHHDLAGKAALVTGGSRGIGAAVARALAGAGADRLIRRWDALTGAVVGQPLAGHEGYVLTLAFGRVPDSGAGAQRDPFDLGQRQGLAIEDKSFHKGDVRRSRIIGTGRFRG